MSDAKRIAINFTVFIVFAGILLTGFFWSREQWHNQRHQEAALTIESWEYRYNNLWERCR
ncbi:MAG: hypothetical protein F4Y88_05795 [Chloroflexi bacterium]|nr:hypothetical protein [Chloroflexota bacterium]